MEAWCSQLPRQKAPQAENRFLFLHMGAFILENYWIRKQAHRVMCIRSIAFNLLFWIMQILEISPSCQHSLCILAFYILSLAQSKQDLLFPFSCNRLPYVSGPNNCLLNSIKSARFLRMLKETRTLWAEERNMFSNFPMNY